MLYGYMCGNVLCVCVCVCVCRQSWALTISSFYFDFGAQRGHAFRYCNFAMAFESGEQL